MIELILEKGNNNVQEEERWDYPVITMYPAPTESKAKFKFKMNVAAGKLFPIGDSPKRISVVGAKGTNDMFLADNNTKHFSAQLYGNGNFMSKVIYENLVEALELDINKHTYFTLELLLEESTHLGYNVYRLKLFVEELEKSVEGPDESQEELTAITESLKSDNTNLSY